MTAPVATAERRRRELERLSHGLGPKVASVILKPETPEEKMTRILKEVPGVKG